MKFIVLLFLCLPACAQTWFSNVSKKPTASSCAIGWSTAVPTIAHIQYGLAAGSYTKVTANTTQYSPSGSQTISGLSAATTYHFKIVADDSSHEWATSVDFTCTTSSTSATNHSVKLNWLASASSGVTGYQVYRSTISGGYYGLLGSVATLAYTDPNVQSGKTYYYTVKAVTSAGHLSGFSNQAQAVVP